MLPVSGAEPTKLETTIYKPDGAGPFPLAVLNHGRNNGPSGVGCKGMKVQILSRRLDISRG